jgi:hypothetical protein
VDSKQQHKHFEQGKWYEGVDGLTCKLLDRVAAMEAAGQQSAGLMHQKQRLDEFKKHVSKHAELKSVEKRRDETVARLREQEELRAAKEQDHMVCKQRAKDLETAERSCRSLVEQFGQWEATLVQAGMDEDWIKRETKRLKLDEGALMSLEQSRAARAGLEAKLSRLREEHEAISKRQAERQGASMVLMRQLSEAQSEMARLEKNSAQRVRAREQIEELT